MKLHPLLVAALLLLPAVASAQLPPETELPAGSAPRSERTPISIGVMGGYGADLYYGLIDLASDRALGDDNCGTLESGIGQAVSAGVFGEYLLPSGIAIGARFLSSPISGSLVAPAAAASAFRKKDGSLVEVTSDNRMELEIPIYQLELYGSFQPFDFPLFVTAGPRVGIPGAAEYTLKEELTAPEDLSFRDGRQYRVISSGDPGTPLLLGLTASARYPLRLSRTVDMIPELAVATTINSITSYGSVRAATGRLSLALRYTFPVPGLEPPPPPPVAVIDTVPPPVVPTPSILRASVTAVGIDRSGAARPTVLVEVREKVTAHEVPILPYLFFAEGGSEIPARYTDGAAAGQGSEALRVYRDLLRIVGERMKTHPLEKITLRGSTSGSTTERARKGLGLERALATRQELVERFGIDSGRIAVEGRLLPERPSALDTNGQEENRRVEIIASETILAPVSIGDTARTMESPGIRFDNEIVAERGVAAWQVEMQLAGRPIRRLHGEAVLTETIDDRFTPSELAAIERGDQPISYTLSARDNDGKTTATEPQTIGITIERSGADSILSSSTADAPAAIVLFDYNSAEIRPAARAMLKRLRSRIPAGASLKLVGFADETGEADYNRKLSLARAQAVSEAIGATAADIQGVGESTLLYDNDAPEGRFYSRSVRIEVK